MDRIVRTDVAVVGAGPAGCRAALSLAQRGLRTVVLDRSCFPRWKPCAGGITRKGFGLVDPALRGQVLSEIRDAVVAYGRRVRARVRVEPALGWLVHRESFDRAHLDLLHGRPGVKVLEGAAVRAIRDLEDGVEIVAHDNRVHARAVVGADGTEGIASRHLEGHGRRRFGLAYEAETACGAAGGDREVLFDFGASPRGYGWIFPKGGHCSAGIYTPDPAAPGIAARCREFTRANGLSGGASYFRARGHRVPRGGDRRDLHGHRLVLTGDAAGLVDPLSGEGIAFALRSGELAARAVEAFLGGRASLAEYTRAVETEIRRDLRWGGLFATLVYRFPRLACRSFEGSPRLCRAVAGVFAGERTYHDLVRRMALRGWMAPLLLARSRRRGPDADGHEPILTGAGRKPPDGAVP